MASAPKTCAVCSVPLDRRNSSGRCRHHFAPTRSPETRAKISATRRRIFAADPVRKARQGDLARAAANSPQSRAAATANLAKSRAWIAGNASRPRGSESRRLAAKRAALTKTAWCPPELREKYLFLTQKKRVRASDARALILEQHEVEMRRFRRSLGYEGPPPEPGEPSRSVAGPIVPMGDGCGDETAANVIASAAEMFGVTVEEIVGKRRMQRLVRPRYTCAYILWRFGNSYTTVGRWLDRDHTTVMHACRWFEADATPSMREVAERYIGGVA